MCVCGVGQSQGLCGDCWNVVAEQHKIFVRACVCVCVCACLCMWGYIFVEIMRLVMFILE